MGTCISFIAFISFFAFIATAIYRFCGKKQENGLKGIYIFTFYLIIAYGCMSFAMIISGNSDKSFFRYFCEPDSLAYVHYGMPMLAVIAILSLLHSNFLKNEFFNRFIKLFNSTLSFAVMLEFFIWGLIISKRFVITVVAAIVISLFVSIMYKGKIEYCNKNNAKQRLFYILSIVMFWTITVFIFEPNQLFINARDEFGILPYMDFLGITISGALLITIVYTFFGFFILSDRQLKLFGTILFGIVFAGYIQANFMNGKMNVMDGATQDWSIQTKLINCIVWGGILLFSTFINLLSKNKKIRLICPIICIYLCMTQAVSLAYMIFSTNFAPKKQSVFLSNENEGMLTNDYAFELDPQNNVIVFVLDWFDQQIMDEILEDYPGFDGDLSDFTCYHNTSSLYAFTSLSIPYLLTQIESDDTCEDTRNFSEYVEYAYSNSRLLYDIDAQGYSIGIYTDSSLVSESAKKLLINNSERAKLKLRYIQTIGEMSGASKYKMAPFIIKGKYSYATSDLWNIAIMENGMWQQDNDIAFNNMLAENGLSLTKDDEYNGAFRFYHLKGAHPRFTMDDECNPVANGSQILQSMGALKIVYAYIHNMQKLDIYDNATIIITADHGQNLFVNRESPDPNEYDLTSSPILYVKLPNEHNDKVRYSNAPVSHTEFAASVIKAVGGDNADSYGRTFDSIADNETRERIFIINGWKYLISGDVNDISSWQLLPEE